MSTLRLFVLGLLTELCYVSFYFCPEGPEEVRLFIAVNVAAYMLFAFIVWRMMDSPAGKPEGAAAVAVIIAFGILFRLTLVPHPAVGSDDIYRYLWDGKVAASGVNPFAYLPTDPHLSRLATADLPAKVNHPDMRTVYPALAQAFFLLSNRLFGDSAPGLKFLLVCVDGLTIALLWAFVHKQGNPSLPVLLYAWSPLPILYFGLDGHIDALGIPFLILALLFFCTSRPVRGALALGVSALAKLFPLLIVPLLLRPGKGIRRFLLPAIPLFMVVLGCLFYLEPTWGVIDSLKTFGARWEFNGGLFSIAYFATGSNEAAHVISGILIVCCMGVLTIINRPFLEKVFWGFVCFILLSPVVHPWYLTWLAALLATRWSTAIFVYLGLSSIANVVVYQYRAFGQWDDQPILLLIEYVPVAILLIREIIRKEVLRRDGGMAPLTTTQGIPL